MKKLKIQVFKGKDGQWYFRIRSSNAQIIAQSEGYTRRSSVMRIIKTLQRKMGTAQIMVIS